MLISQNCPPDTSGLVFFPVSIFKMMVWTENMYWLHSVYFYSLMSLDS